tara:strand:+ start:66 stop:680 length:615 start_codon:yes stop_codon:yes gene_type:complete
MKSIVLLFLFTLSSCALFTTSNLSKNLKNNIQKICISSTGKGRLVVEKQKYVFSYESALKEVEHKWLMAFNFPLYGHEHVELDWSEPNKLKQYFSFEDRILKEQQGVSPESLELFFATWSEFLLEVIQLKNNKRDKLNFNWEAKSKELIAKKDLGQSGSKAIVSFKNLVSNNYFGRYDIVMQQGNGDIPFKIEVVVRKCLEKAD